MTFPRYAGRSNTKKDATLSNNVFILPVEDIGVEPMTFPRYAGRSNTKKDATLSNKVFNFLWRISESNR